MRLLLDQGFGRSAATLLREKGHDAVHVGERGLAAADDQRIIELARLETRVVVTLDADFHALLALSGATGPSVIRIRIEGLKHDAAAELINMVVNAIRDELDRGVMVSVEPDRVRVRDLPLVRNTPPASA